jgi:hypothetical protein
MPGAAAATGLTKSQRAQEGKVGGIIGLLFLGAFVVPEGLSCAGLQSGNLPPWILLDQVKRILASENGQTVEIEVLTCRKPSANLNITDDPINNFAADVDPTLPVANRKSQAAFYSVLHLTPALSSLGR